VRGAPCSEVAGGGAVKARRCAVYSVTAVVCQQRGESSVVLKRCAARHSVRSAASARASRGASLVVVGARESDRDMVRRVRI